VSPGLDLPTLVGAAAAFGLVAALWAIALVVLARIRGRRERLLRERLDFAVGQPTSGPRTLRLWHEGQEATTQVLAAPGRPPLEVRLRQLGRDAGWSSPPEQVILWMVLAALGAGVACVLWTGRPFAGPVGAAVVAAACVWVTSARIAKRVQLFDRQLVDALELSARALRVGHPLVRSFELIADEIPEPVGAIFKEICQSQDLGAKPEEALMRAASLSRSTDLRLFATSLAINLRAGGNLADVMEGLAFVIRERMRLGRRFRVLSAQTQMSKRILLVMPVAMFVVMNLMNRRYMEMFYSTGVGNALLLAACGSMLLGWFVMNRMAIVRA
jgi:tight adherence protein B